MNTRSSIATAALGVARRLVLALAILTGPQLAVLKPVDAQPSPQGPSAKTGLPELGSAHRGLLEGSTFLTVKGPSGSYRLEVFIARPDKVQGQLPIALITHGKQRTPAEMELMRAEVMAPLARDLAHRGYLAVAVVRRGFGRSGGTPGVATNAPYAKCTFADLQRYFMVESDDLQAALSIVAERPDADAARAIAIGGSVGGGAVLALASRRPNITVVFFAGAFV
jgi:pimeloyl-ACP methyl ester carboxylesterase